MIDPRKNDIDKLTKLAAQFAELKARVGELSPEEQKQISHAFEQPIFPDDHTEF